MEEHTLKTVFLNSAPYGLEKEFQTLLTPNAIQFLVKLIEKFECKINDLYYTRLKRKCELNDKPDVLKFVKCTAARDDWKIAPLNKRLHNRHLDLGDVSPVNLNHFIHALHADVQGIQVDFDDGHCPTWKNQIIGLYNVYQIVHGKLKNVPNISDAPILMLRPRAWNMMEHNMSINGREVPGPLFDFALLIFHNSNILAQHNAGPCFYLSKVEGANEAQLWNEIFSWSERKLMLPHGTIKASVLIENIFSIFEAERILYELRDHSLGLNYGIWDYCASIISKFGNNRLYILPDRNKYVNMSKPFLWKSMEYIIQLCHKRGAHATGGMVACLLPEPIEVSKYMFTVTKVRKSKLAEIEAGIDGFLVYDIKLVPHLNELWKKYGGLFPNQISYKKLFLNITEMDLLRLPKGSITMDGLMRNISVSILFIFNWLNGIGQFTYTDALEDSATAEISRAQVWQWIKHGAQLEDQQGIITRQLIHICALKVYKNLEGKYGINNEMKSKLSTSVHLFMMLVTSRELPEFITTYLNDEHIFRKIHANL